MADLNPDSAPQVGQIAVKPKGILPRNLQNWFLIVGGTLVVLFVLLNSGGTGAKNKKGSAAEAAKPVVIDPSQARIQEYRKKIDSEAKKLEAEQERLRQVQESMGTPVATGSHPAAALSSMYPPGYPPGYPNGYPVSPSGTPAAAAPADPIKADREKREYASLFASNVALSLRPSTNDKGAAGTKTEKAASEPGVEGKEEKEDHGTLEATSPSPSPVSSLRSLADVVSAPAPAKPVSATTTEQGSIHREDSEDDDRSARKKTRSPQELRQADGAGHRLFEGTVIETVLTNRIAGDFSGPVNCLVSTNVYSHNRQHLLIPQGSRVLGEVKRVSNFGQQRVAVFFHRLIMPDGYSLDLDQFQGLNQIGETGLKDQVNHHYVQIFGASLALGAIAGFSEAGTSTGFVTSGIDSYRDGFSNSLSQTSQRILDKFLNQLPTITIREGYRVKVYLAGDLLVPDYTLHRIQDDL